MALRIYSGEYLIGPTLLHFGGNWCSHNCAYCFANLNKPDRAAAPSDVAKIYKWYDTGSTSIEFELMQSGHPVMMSNDSDPCSKTNYALHAAVHDASQALGFNMSYQTRGGVIEAEQRIINSRPTMVYVSLTTDQPETGKRVEPGAPFHVQRMEFIRQLKAAGHHVVIGLNPYVPAWWDNLAATFEVLAGWGVAHVWHQPMHMSHIQVAAMTDSSRERNAELVAYAAKKKAPDVDEYRGGLNTLHALGFNTIHGGVSEKLGFWDAYFALGFPFSPTLDALVRDVSEQAGGAPAMIDLDEFNEWADIGLTKDRVIWKEFLNGFGRSIRNEGEQAKAKNQAELNSWLWRVEDFPTRFRHNCFARVLYNGGHASDPKGRPLMAVSKHTFPEPEIGGDWLTFFNEPIRRG